MTDFDYDCYLKKSIAHSAAKRKGGSKSKKCNLSSDYLTEKQWKERCGAVMAFQINKPMKWAEFNQLPKDLKEEYMNKLIDKYSANARGLADMFGVSVATIFRVVKKDNLNVKFLKGRHPSGEKQEAFTRFINGEDDLDEIAVTNLVPEQECVPIAAENEACESDESVVINTQADDREQRTRLDSFTMNFSGDVNVDMIANSLRYILHSGGKAKIQIICELE